jgi:hypothetical protein
MEKYRSDRRKPSVESIRVLTTYTGTYICIYVTLRVDLSKL